MRDFRGKAVAVTGAANGIGRALALAFAREGARIALADVDKAGLREVAGTISRMGCEVREYRVDVSDAGQVEALCDGVYRDLGRVDVLCNNAGVAAAGDFEDMPLDDLRWVVGVNLMGVIHGCHFFYPRMIAQGGGGHIVNTASAGGLFPFASLAVYCATKSGLVGLSEAMRAEAVVHGIGVTAVCPGVIATDIVKRGRVCSGSRRTTPRRMAEKADRMLQIRGYGPDRVAARVLRAVRKDVGVARITPEAYAMDVAYRLSRWGFGLAMSGAARAAQRFL